MNKKLSYKLKESLIEQHNDFEKKEEKSEKRMLTFYSDSLIDLKKYLAQLYENFEDEGKLTYDEMIKYNRLSNMDDELKGITVKLYRESTKEISSILDNTYKSGFNGTSEALSGVLGKKSLLPIIKDDELFRAVTNEISGLKWTSRMGLHREYAVCKIRETIVRGLHEGETYSQMAKRLDKAMNGDVVNPIRIVRTEGHRVFSQAKKDRLDKISGVGLMKEWITSQDERVRENNIANHVLMNGKKVSYNENFILPNGNSGFCPGMIGAACDDINCRCIWVIDIID